MLSWTQNFLLKGLILPPFQKPFPIPCGHLPVCFTTACTQVLSEPGWGRTLAYRVQWAAPDFPACLTKQRKRMGMNFMQTLCPTVTATSSWCTQKQEGTSVGCEGRHGGRVKTLRKNRTCSRSWRCQQERGGTPPATVTLEGRGVGCTHQTAGAETLWKISSSNTNLQDAGAKTSVLNHGTFCWFSFPSKQEG